MGNCSSKVKPVDESPAFVSVYDNENEYSYDHSIDHKNSPLLVSSNNSLNSILCNKSIERRMITHG